MTEMRELTPKGTGMLKTLEKVVPYVYDDSVFPTRPYVAGEHVGGTLTGWVGHTGPDLNKYISTTRTKPKSIPASVGDAWLDHDTDVTERALTNLVMVPLDDDESDALRLWAFNVGVGATASSSLIRKLNKGDYASVPGELAKWNKTKINGKSVVSKGLVSRRAQEAALWTSGMATKPTAANIAPVETADDSMTQVAEPAPHPTSSLEYVTGAATLAGPAAGFANSTGVVAWGFAALLVIAAAVIGAIVIKRQFFPK